MDTKEQELVERLCAHTGSLHKGLNTMVNYRRNAVLVPLVQQQDGWGLLFEVRAQTLKWQPGEICFPGGRIESEDVKMADTALRETYEEIGIPPEDINVLGALNPVISPIGAEIYPVLGTVKSLAKLKVSKAEVDSTFVAPLEFFYNTKPRVGVAEIATRITDCFPLDLVGSYPTDWRVRNSYKMYFYQYEQHLIWGLTAHITRTFLKQYEDILRK